MLQSINLFIIFTFVIEFYGTWEKGDFKNVYTIIAINSNKKLISKKNK